VLIWLWRMCYDELAIFNFDGLAFCFFNFDVLMLCHFLDFDNLIGLPNKFTLYKLNINFRRVETPYQFFSKSWDTLSVFFKKLKHPFSFFLQKVETPYQFFPKSWNTLSVSFFSKNWDTLSVFSKKLRHPTSFFFFTSCNVSHWGAS
jgi:hypothetical protein